MTGQRGLQLSFCPYRVRAMGQLRGRGWRWSSSFVDDLASCALDRAPGVYTLWRGESCEYVGASGNVASRIVGSIAERCSALPHEPWLWAVSPAASVAAAFQTEAWAIAALSPSVNRVRPGWRFEAAAAGWFGVFAANQAGEVWLRTRGADAIVDRLRAGWETGVAARLALEKAPGGDAYRAERRARAAVRLGDMIEASRYRQMRENPERQGCGGFRKVGA